MGDNVSLEKMWVVFTLDTFWNVRFGAKADMCSAQADVR
jgi:hypothetical protein